MTILARMFSELMGDGMCVCQPYEWTVLFLAENVAVKSRVLVSTNEFP